MIDTAKSQTNKFRGAAHARKCKTAATHTAALSAKGAPTPLYGAAPTQNPQVGGSYLRASRGSST